MASVYNCCRRRRRSASLSPAQPSGFSTSLDPTSFDPLLIDTGSQHTLGPVGEDPQPALLGLPASAQLEIDELSQALEEAEFDLEGWQNHIDRFDDRALGGILRYDDRGDVLSEFSVDQEAAAAYHSRLREQAARSRERAQASQRPQEAQQRSLEAGDAADDESVWSLTPRLRPGAFPSAEDDDPELSLAFYYEAIEDDPTYHLDQIDWVPVRRRRRN